MKIKNLKLLIGFLAVFMLHCSTLVRFTTEPSGAKVYVDGDYIGETPIKKRLTDLAWKRHDLSIVKSGYKTVNRTVRKEAKGGAIFSGIFFSPFWFFWCYGPKKEQNFILEKGSGDASIHNKQDDYLVYVNGKLLQQGKSVYKPGVYQVSYEAKNNKLEGQTAEIEFKKDNVYYLDTSSRL